nr:Chain B, Asn-pro-ile-ser-asp-phe-pro-asp [Homo sapiens]
NPISDFPD